ATGSFKAIDELLAQLTPEQRESPIARYYRKSWAESRDDYAEFKRLDQQQPTYEEAEAPLLSVYISGMNYFAHGEAELARAHIAKAFDGALALTKSQPSNLRTRLFLGGMEAIRGHPEAAVRLTREVVELLPETRDAVDGP